jgi:hypothetical protein
VRTHHGEFERAIHEERPQDLEREGRTQIQAIESIPWSGHQGFVSGDERPNGRIF